MHIQHVLKGMALADDADADALLAGGICCNWWRRVRLISPEEAEAQLTERNLDWHLNRFDSRDPATGAPFRDNTPYISTTAGTYERDPRAARNLPRPALLTALAFATADFTAVGYVFHAYVFTLGKRGVPLREFAEETRELHVYTRFQRYHPEGEVVAKIDIPAVRIERWERYDGPRVRADLAAQRRPASGTALVAPDVTRHNPKFRRPEQYANLRRVTV